MRKKQAIESTFEEAQMGHLPEDFKAVITNMFKELKETVLPEVMQGMAIPHRIENINKERNHKKNRIVCLELKCSVTEMKTLLGTQWSVWAVRREVHRNYMARRTRTKKKHGRTSEK
jgi:hypothetical protein